MKIEFLDLKKQNAEAHEEIQFRLQQVIKSGNFVLGPELSEFEKAFADYIGSRFSVGVNSGTGALWLALKALGIGPNDKVITVANTFIATWEAIALSGASCHFVDIDPKTFLLDPQQIEKNISPETKAIIAVHLYGSPCEMDTITEIAKKHRIFVIEDACQAHGAVYKGKKVGNWGDIGCFSFYPGKNLGAFGDGGAITTNSEQLAEIISMIRNHGQKEKYNHQIFGINDRLDNIQAAVLLPKLKKLDEWNRKRSEIAQDYDQRLGKVFELQLHVRDANPVHHLYTILSKRRNELINELSAAGIPCGLHYPTPIHHQPAFRKFSPEAVSLPHSEAHCANTLSLPMHPHLTSAEIQYICNQLISLKQKLD